MNKNVKQKSTKPKKVRIPSPDQYYLDRLFDPEELYFTPMDQLLKRYKKTNLRYKIEIE